MSKLIIEMEMPKGCSWVEKGIEKRCPMAGIDHYLQIRCRVQSGRIVHTINKFGGVDCPSWCPIKGVLPDEHGDLVDYDEVEKEFNRLLTYMEEVPDENGIVWFRRETIMPRGYTMKFHTIIPAERKDDGTTAD